VLYARTHITHTDAPPKVTTQYDEKTKTDYWVQYVFADFPGEIIDEYIIAHSK
jgi:hypothetical protein